MKVCKTPAFAFFFLITVLVGFNPVITLSAGPSGPDIVISKKDFDIGTLLPGKRTKEIITIKNNGPEPLNVRFVRTSNERRLSARLSASVINPESAVELGIEISSYAWESGDFTEYVLLYSNDPDEPLVKVKFKGNIQSPILWTPKIFQTSIHRNDIKPFNAVRIKQADGEGLGQIRVTSYVPYLSAEAKEESDGGYIVTPSLDPSVPTGEYLGYLNIETEHPRFAFFQIPVRLSIMGDLVKQPDRLDFGIVEEGKPAQARILLHNQGDREVSIIKAEPHLPAKSEISMSKSGKDYQITVLIPSPPPLQDLKGHINIFTDHPDEPVIQVSAAGWTLSDKPFNAVSGDENNSRLLGLVKAALFDDRISPEVFIDRVFGGVRDDRSVSLLLKAFSKENWLIRARAIEVLGVLGNMQALDFVRTTVTQDTDEQVRLAAITALARLAGTEALPELLLALQDDDEWVREDAATLLGKLGDKRAVSALSAALSDEDEDVHAAVEESLKILTQESNKSDK